MVLRGTPCPTLSCSPAHAMSASTSDHSCEAIDRKTDSPTRYSAIYTTLLANDDISSQCSSSADLDGLFSRASVSDTIVPRGSVAAWQLDEIGYKHIPMCVPNHFLETESYSWEDTLRAIDDHDWPVEGQRVRCNSSNGSANEIRNTFMSTSCSLEDLTAFSVNPFQDRPTLVTTVQPCNKSEYSTLGTDGECNSKASGFKKTDIRAGTYQGLIARSTLDMRYANKSTLVTRKLQINPFERVGYMPPESGVSNGEDTSRKYKGMIAPVVVKGKSILDCSTSRYPIIAPQYEEMYSSDEESHNIASPTETVATSVSGTPPFSVEELSKSEKDALCAGLLDVVNIDKSNSPISATATYNTLGKHSGTIEGSHLSCESTYIADVDEIEQYDTTFLLATGHESTKCVTASNLAVQSGECCLVERIPTFISKYRNSALSHSAEETVDEEGSSRKHERAAYDQHVQQVNLIAKPIIRSTPYHNVIPLTVFEQPVIKDGTLAQSPRENITDDTNAQGSEKTRLPLMKKLVQEAGANCEGNNLSLSAEGSQHAASLTMAIAEWHATLPLESPYRTLSRQSPKVVSPLRNPITATPIIDMASIMLSLATYSLGNSPPVRKLKRSMDYTDFTECAELGQPMKKQRLRLGCEPAIIEDASISEVLGESRKTIESYESYTARRVTVGVPGHCQDDARVFESAADAAVRAGEQAVCLPGNSIPERTEFKTQVNNLTTDLLLRQYWEREADCASTVAHLAHSPDAHIQTTDTDMQELVTTDWMFPYIESPTSALNSFSELCGSKTTFRPLKSQSTLHSATAITADACSAYLESRLDVHEPLLVPKREEAFVPSPSTTSKDIALGKKNKHNSIGLPNPRQTRSGVMKTKARFIPKCNAAPTQKSTSKTMLEATTPTRPEVLPITPNMKLSAKTKISTPTKEIGKRVTRHASAVEYKIKKASEKEENIGKRLRNKD